jgi:hypothetical protein
VETERKAFVNSTDDECYRTQRARFKDWAPSMKVFFFRNPEPARANKRCGETHTRLP